MSSTNETVYVFESTSQDLSNAPEAAKQFLSQRKSTQTTPQQPQPTANQPQAIQELVEVVPTTRAESIQETIAATQDADGKQSNGKTPYYITSVAC